MASIHEILLRVTGQTEDAEEDLRDLATQLNIFDRQRAEASVGIDESEFERKRRRIIAQLRRLGGERAEILIEAAGAATTIFQLRAVESQLNSLQREAAKTIIWTRLQTRLRGVGTGFRNFRRQLTPTTLRVGRFSFAIGRLSEQALIIASVSMKALIAAVLTLASSLALAVAGLAQLITTMGRAIVAAVELAGAYTIAFVGTLIPVVTLGIGVVRRFKETSEEAGTAANRLAEAAKGVGRTFDRVMAPAADRVLGALAFGLERLRPLIASLQSEFRAFGRVAAESIRGAARELTSDAWRDGFARLIDGARRIVPVLTDAFLGLAATLRNIAVATMPLLERAIRRLAGRTREWERATADAGAVRSFLRDARRELSVFTDLLSEAWTLLRNVFGAGAGVGRQLVRELTAATREANRWLETARGQRAINRFWRTAAGHLRTWARTLVQITDMFAALISVTAPFGRRLVRDIGLLAERWAEWLRSEEGTERMNQIMGNLIPLLEQLAGLAFNLIRIFLVFSEVVAEGLRPLFEILNAILGPFAELAEKILDLPRPLRQLLGAIVATGTAMRLLRLALTLGRFAFATLLLPLRLLTPAFVAFGSVARLVVPLLALLRTGAIALGAALLANPVVAIAAAIAVLILLLAKLGLLDDVWRALRKAAVAIWRAIKTAVVTNARAMLAVARTVFRAILAVGRTAWRALRAVTTTVFRAILSVARSVWGAVRSVVTGALRGALSVARSVFGALRSAASSAFRAVIGAARSILRGLAGIVRGFVSSAVDVVRNLGGAFFNAGRSIIQSMINGVRSLAGSVKDAVGDVVQGAKDLLPFSEPRDPRSPLFGLDRAGRAIIDNLATGIRDAGGELAGALSRELDLAVPAVAVQPGAGLAGAGPLTQNFNVTTPSVPGTPDPRLIAAQLALLERQRGAGRR